MKLKVDVAISRLVSNRVLDVMRLTFTDSEACVRFLEVEMSLRDFALALTGTHVSDMDAEVRELDKVGMVSETKTEWVPRARDGNYRSSEAPRTPEEDGLLAPFEVDGWSGCVRDLRNSHMQGRGEHEGKMRVVFRRHVPRTDEEAKL